MHVQTSVLKHAAASHYIRELRRARDHSTHRHTGASRCVALWRSWTARRPQTTHPVLAIDGFMTQHEPRAPVFATASDPKDLPARTRHRVQDLVRATADNRSRTGQAARRERCHTEPCIKRDGRACARFATAGGPPRGAPARMASCRRGRHESGFGARLANRGGQSARRGRRSIGGWDRRGEFTCSRGGSAIRAARSMAEGVLHTAHSGGVGQKVVGWVRSGRARFERSAGYLIRVGAVDPPTLTNSTESLAALGYATIRSPSGQPSSSLAVGSQSQRAAESGRLPAAMA